MSGMFEVLAVSDDEHKIAQQQVTDRLAAAVYDVRAEFGDFLFKAADIHEFRTRVHLVKPDMMRVIDRHVPPVSSVMGRIATRRGCILEKEFRSHLAGRQGMYPPQTEDDVMRPSPDRPDVKARWDEFDKGRPQRIQEFEQERRQRSAADVAPEDPSGGGGGLPSPGSAVPGMAEVTDTPDEAQHMGYRLGWYATATGDGGALDTDETYHQESGALIPEGDWPGFENRVDQTSDKVDDHVFAPGEHDKTYTVDTGADFVSGRESRRRYAADSEVDPGSEVGALGDMGMMPSGTNYTPPTNSATSSDNGAPGSGADVGAAGALPEVPDAQHMGSAYTDRMLGPGMDPEEARAVAPAVNSLKPGLGGPGKSTLHQQPSGLGLNPDRIKDNMVQASVQKLFLRYVGFCRQNRLPLTLSALERHGKRLSSRDYLVVAMGLNKLAETYQGEGDVEKKSGPFAGPHGSFPVGTPKDLSDAKSVCNNSSVSGKHPGTCEKIDHMQRPARRRQGAPDYLMKAKDALEGLLNQKAEEFQTGISPLQQALQVVQQSQAIEQANNPLSVQPPAGTVNVLPDAPGGLPGDPAAGGGMPPADQSAPPPAAGGAQPVGPDPQQMSARRQGGLPKGRRPVKVRG